MHAAHAHSSSDDGHRVSHVLTALAIGGAAVAAGVVLAPHVLPLVGIGGEQVFEDTMWLSHGYIAGKDLAITEAGSGLAGVLNRAMANYIPLIGEKLAMGGWFNALSSVGVGVGGLLLGNRIEKSENGEGFKWGKAIKIGGLVTSALIALPVLLSGLTMGITYLAMLTGNNTLIDSTVGFVNHTLGVSGGKMTSSFLGLSGAAAGLAHLFTCGASVLPLGLSAMLMRNEKKQQQAHASPIRCELEMPSQPAQGVDCVALLRLVDTASGKPVSDDEIAITHTRKIHLLVADSSLRDYQHIHPEPTGAPGEYVFRFHPKTGNRYTAWADFTTLKDNKNHIIKTPMPLKGRNVAPSLRKNDQAALGDLRFSWQPRQPLQKGRDAIVDVTITDANGNPITDLQPVMGAFAHLVGFSADGSSLMHCHPMGAEPQQESARGGPQLSFHVRPESVGPVQFYLQVKRADQEIFVPFAQTIKAARAEKTMPVSAMAACHR